MLAIFGYHLQVSEWNSFKMVVKLEDKIYYYFNLYKQSNGILDFKITYLQGLNGQTTISSDF